MRPVKRNPFNLFLYKRACNVHFRWQFVRHLRQLFVFTGSLINHYPMAEEDGEKEHVIDY